VAFTPLAAALAAVALATATATSPPALAPTATTPASALLAAAAAGSTCGWREAAQRLAQDLAAQPATATDPRVAVIQSALAKAGITSTASPACGTSGTSPTPGPGSPTAPGPAGATQRPDHVVVVVEENEDAAAIVGSSQAPYLSQLAAQGASFTHARAETHPSQPNYLALFSGSQQGVSDDSCLGRLAAPNLGSELLAAGHSFVGYSEDLPRAGFTGCTSGKYAQKHSPWANFSNVPASSNQPWTAWPTDYAQLPAVAFLTPNLCNDMHDCGVPAGDSWLKTNLAGYATWAAAHNSWLCVTWDEASTSSPDNSIATLITGAGIRPGRYDEPIDHYSLLRTIEDAFGLAPTGQASSATPITDIWGSAPAAAPGASNAPITGSAGSTGDTGSAPAVLPLVAGSGASTPVATSAQLQQAITAARPGDTIALAAGRYTALQITGRSGTAQAPITLVGPREAVIDGGSATGGYALHLQGASFWQLSGFTVTGGGKGVVVDNGQHNLLDSLDIGRAGDEAVHFRGGSSDNTLQRSTVHDTGLAQPGFGEGAYLGSARSNWPAVSAGQPDLSMRNRIVANTFHGITAENVDVKEATAGALITGNHFDGSAISGANYADSIVDVKGYDSTVSDNITTGTSPALRTIITTHVITTPATSGCGNTITGNTVQGSLPAGGLVAVDTKCGAGGTTGGQG